MYSQDAYRALALFIHETVEERTFRATDFEVGISRMGPGPLNGAERNIRACIEFMEALTEEERSEIIGEAAYGKSISFLMTPYHHIWNYLSESPEWRRTATETLREYVAACDQGYRDDRAIDEARNRMIG